jgi:hypothetical protein
MQCEVFSRITELEELRERFSCRRSFLLHGPAGVGKTLLLARVLSEFPNILYSPRNPTPQVLYQNLADALSAARDRKIAEARSVKVPSLPEKSAVAVKGTVREALRNSPYVLVLDHLARPSQSLAGSVRELMVECSVPVVAVSRSSHMEDAGFALSLFADRSEKFAIRNFDPKTALQFATWYADKERLAAGNLKQFLDRVVQFSGGNPGAIVQMIRMAGAPKYSSDGQIKSTPLYIDFRILTVSQ